MKTLAEFKTLTDAEEFFKFFELPYDQHFVNVNRLHILKQFSSQIETINPNLSEEETLAQYRSALEQAYQCFQTSTPQEQKLFKVFNEPPPGVVLLSDIKTD